MKDIDNLKRLFSSQNDQDTMIAQQIALGMGLNWLDIFKIKHEAGAIITDDEAIKAGVTDNSANIIQKCFKCESDDFEIEVLDTMQGKVCEEKTICKKCGHSTYWGYGHFDFNNIT